MFVYVTLHIAHLDSRDHMELILKRRCGRMLYIILYHTNASKICKTYDILFLLILTLLPITFSTSNTDPPR